MKRKVVVKGPVLSRSGYGEHARFVLRSLREFEHLFDIYILNIRWGQTGWIWEDSIERRWIDQTIQNTMHYINSGGQFDVSLQVTIPGEWEPMAAVNIGCTAGTETTKISPQWMQKSNEMVDKIITVSEHAAYAFKNTSYQMRDPEDNVVGIMTCETPVEAVNYPVRPEMDSRQVGTTCEVAFDFETDFNFLLLAQWSPRKNLENTIRWWVEEFIDNPDVGLIVKTSLANDSRIDREYAEHKLQQLLNDYPDRECKVHFLHGQLTETEMIKLYTQHNVKALISLTHGEGFNLPAFEAAINDLPVIAPGWGGHVDFLYKTVDGEKPKELFVNVDFDIAPIQPEAVWDTVLQADSHWCFPKSGSAKMKYRSVLKNYEEYKKNAEELGEWVRSEFEASKQYRKFVESLELKGLTLEEPEVLEFD